MLHFIPLISLFIVAIPCLSQWQGQGSSSGVRPAGKSSTELSGISTDPPPEDAAFADLDKIDWGLPMLERLGGWVHSGIKYLRPKMDLRPSGVFAVFERGIRMGEVLMRIPEEATISPKMLEVSSWSHADQVRISKLAPEAKIALFLLREGKLGAESRWNILLSKVFTTTPAVPPTVREWSDLNKRVKNLYKTVKALASLSNSSWSDSYVALHFAKSRTISLPKGCSLQSERQHLVLGLDLLNHVSNWSAVNARVGYSRSRLNCYPLLVEATTNITQGYEVVVSYSALVNSISPKVKPCEWWLVKYNFVPEILPSGPLVVTQLPGVTHPRYTAESELGEGDARGIGRSPEWIRLIQKRWKSKCLRSYHHFDGLNLPTTFLNCARMERLIVAHLDYIHNDVPSGPTRLVVDAHSDWQEGDLLEWERMERPMITELSQAATHLLKISGRVLNRVEAGNMTRTDLVDQSLFTMGLQRCAQYNKENVEKLARVLVGLSMLNETAYAEEIKSAGENSMEWWKAAEQSVAMRALSDDEIEERMTHDEL